MFLLGCWDQRTLLVAGTAALAFLLLFACPLVRPALIQDDIEILVRSVDGPTTRANLWVPANEHAMPLGRLLTWLLLRVATPPTWIPFAAVLQGVLALLAGMILLDLFVQRERGHPWFGLVGMILFGVTTVYQQAVYWFAASFQILALDTLLLALLASQRWRQSGHPGHLALCVIWCVLAPAWFASGILAGPLCCLYLSASLVWKPNAAESKPTLATREPSRPGFFSLLCSALPLAGSGLFLAVSLPRTAQHIMHLDHYQGKSSLEAFQPLVGIAYTGRSLIENLMLGVIGVGGIDLPIAVVVVVLVGLVIAAAWWWRGAPARPLLVLGLGLILGSYVLTYSARADLIGEARMNQPNWSRYHLFPQLGLVLVVCGGLSGRRLDPAGTLSWQQTRGLLLLIAVLFILQLPRGLLARWPAATNPEEQLALLRSDPWRWCRQAWEDWREDRPRAEQLAVLRRIGEMDARCRQQRIAAPTARAALDWLKIPGCQPWENGWDLLRGSDDPLPHTVEEVRKLLRDLP